MSILFSCWDIIENEFQRQRGYLIINNIKEIVIYQIWNTVPVMLCQNIVKVMNNLDKLVKYKEKKDSSQPRMVINRSRRSSDAQKEKSGRAEPFSKIDSLDINSAEFTSRSVDNNLSAKPFSENKELNSSGFQKSLHKGRSKEDPSLSPIKRNKLRNNRESFFNSNSNDMRSIYRGTMVFKDSDTMFKGKSHNNILLAVNNIFKSVDTDKELLVSIVLSCKVVTKKKKSSNKQNHWNIVKEVMSPEDSMLLKLAEKKGFTIERAVKNIHSGMNYHTKFEGINKVLIT